MEPCSLRNKRFQSSYSAKVGAEAIKNGRGGGREKRKPSLPSPSPVISFFFLFLSQRSRRTRAESLATQARNPVKTKIAVRAGVCKCLLPFICFSYGVYLSVLVTCYAYRGNIVYNMQIREDSWINTQDRVLRIEPEPEPFKVHSSR